MSLKTLRINALMDSYKALMKSGKIDYKTTIIASMKILVESPAPSFFLSPESIRNYIFMYERGVFLKRKLALQMMKDLYSTYQRLQKQYPDKTKADVIEMVADQPAPRYYLSWNKAAEHLFWQSSKK